MALLRELFAFIRLRRKFWLIPIFALMLTLGGLLILTKGSALAPFVHTLFRDIAARNSRDILLFITTAPRQL